MTKEQVQSLTSDDLKAMVRSTNPCGQFWLQMNWARDELARRRKLGRIEFKSAGATRKR